MTPSVKFSPLALAQLDLIWDYDFERFGLEKADAYVDGIFDALEELNEHWVYQAAAPRLVPPDLISDITQESIHFIRYKHEILYLKHLNDQSVGVVCILGEKMDTPNRLLDMLNSPKSSFTP